MYHIGRYSEKIQEALGVCRNETDLCFGEGSDTSVIDESLVWLAAEPILALGFLSSKLLQIGVILQFIMK